MKIGDIIQVRKGIGGSDLNKNKASMSSYKAQVKQYGTAISKAAYKDLREYAEHHMVKISGFKDFVGDIEVIKTVIDDINAIAADFSAILEGRRSICLELDYNMGEDFASTISQHIIHLNAVYFSDLRILAPDYADGEMSGRFVKNTDWRAIVRHEVGHVVANTYRIDPMTIAMDIMKTKSKKEVLFRLTQELSIYSAAYEDGREIISESFAGYYSSTDNEFAKEFVKRCIEMTKKAGDNMKSWDEAMYWATNQKWYRFNKEKDCIELTKLAPPRAIDSFRLWLKRNRKL